MTSGKKVVVLSVACVLSAWLMIVQSHLHEPRKQNRAAQAQVLHVVSMIVINDSRLPVGRELHCVGFSAQRCDAVFPLESGKLGMTGNEDWKTDDGVVELHYLGPPPEEVQ